MQPRKAILVFRCELLKSSEEWILEEPSNLTKFDVRYIGTERSKQGTLPQIGFIVDPREFIEDTLALSFAPVPRYQALLDFIKPGTPGLIHAHYGMDAATALIMADRLKIPLMISFHGADACLSDSSLRQASAQMRRYLFWKNALKRRASIFIADSNFIAAKLQERGFPIEKIRVLYAARHQNISAISTSNKLPQLITNTEFTEKDGTEYLLHAVREVQKTFPLLKLVICGEGEQRQSIEKLAGNLGVNASFIGSCSAQKRAELMRQSFLFCAAYITAENGDAEGRGQDVIDAQAAGLPVVATRSGAIPEVVEENVTALLAPERDSPELAKKILVFLRDKNLRALAETRGPVFAETKFNPKVFSKNLEQLYTEVTAP